MAAKHAAAGASRLKRDGQKFFTGAQPCGCCGMSMRECRWDEVVPTLDADLKGVWVHRSCLAEFGRAVSAVRDQRAALLHARIEGGELAVSPAALAVARELRLTSNPRAVARQEAA